MLVGKEFGPYLVDKELGSGAMGTVVRAKHVKNGNRVAIKLMSLALGSSEAALNRFRREVTILKQLDHPNIVKYMGSGKYHGAPFYIMEYVEGESLDHILHRRTRIPWEEVIELGIHLCAGLQHAHDKGIIHRDLKPSNLMILKGGVVKLTDFGIAKDQDVTALTAANSTVGTAAYMSPEQCRGVRDITHKTDLYSMGIMFYELLTGRKPFVGETAMEVFLQHANNTDYKTPAEIIMEIPIWLDTLVCQLMEKEPAKRPLNASTVADSLQLIKEKIEVQRSAGVEAATKRKIDRTGRDKKLDEDDKTAARAMLGKKKKKPKVMPFYTKGWFTIFALMLIGAGAMTGVYFAFLRTPSPEALYADAELLMKTDKRGARKGPIALYLSAYPADAKVETVQKWADDIDFEELDRAMHNRRERKFTIGGNEEQLFRDALNAEDVGNLADAAKSWKALSEKKSNADPDIRAWGLVGERYLHELAKVEDHYAELRKRAADVKAESSDNLERIALVAARAELAADFKKASDQWKDVRDRAEKQSDRRGMFLLAAKRYDELRSKQ
ncbi:MAG: serine/threonine protein kinase [Planctomycetes bacterium]|nr:serine/threonine protein kinase [Planctomycetota bacterium]